ncbi:unnamed protein product [Owenia fusiformis]|uniref:VWFA domain-containing protein n=1 Tax=Owenia fusiformis TaxID=6347 RepID=A0A8S4NGZ7_OWEFU|nr:unnamed protein product [Owenia fusiformis]
MAREMYLIAVILTMLGVAGIHGQWGSICSDIVFGFQTSCRISDDIKDDMKDFLETLVRFLDRIGAPDSNNKRSTQIGLFAYDSASRKAFGFGDAVTQNDVINAIKDFEYGAEDCEMVTSKAIDMAREDFFETGKQDSRGPNVLFLLTDGQTQLKYINETKASISRLRAKNNTYVFILQLPWKSDTTGFGDMIDEIGILADEDNIFPYSEEMSALNALARTVYDRFEMLSDNMMCPETEMIPSICDQDPSLDILIILEHSSKRIPINATFVRNAMRNLVVNGFPNVGEIEHCVKFALLTYNKKVTTEMLFNDTASSTLAGTLAAIDSASMMLRRKKSRIDLALEYANNVVFTPAWGDRPFAHNLVVLVTHGVTMEGKRWVNTIRAAKALKERSGMEAVEIFLLVLPGTRPMKLEDQQETWGAISSEPMDTHFKGFYDVKELPGFINELAHKICNSTGYK